jgi:hypothetical protein
MCFYFGTDPSLMPYMSDDGMSEDSSVVGMPHGKVWLIYKGWKEGALIFYYPTRFASILSFRLPRLLNNIRILPFSPFCIYHFQNMRYPTLLQNLLWISKEQID